METTITKIAFAVFANIGTHMADLIRAVLTFKKDVFGIFPTTSTYNSFINQMIHSIFFLKIKL
ncbi:MAG: hypothetical protein ACXABO_07690 [Promethearchaeota archaeon]|jgi:hypothetical protein